MKYGVDFFVRLNPDFLLSIAEEYFHHDPENSPAVIRQLSAILTRVVESCPGLLPALYRLASVHFMAGDYRAASTTLHHIIDHVDPTYIDAYLLMAKMGLEQKNIGQASQYLELGLSYNFQVRDRPLYHLLLAKVQRLRKEHEAALASLRVAMIQSGMRSSGTGVKPPKFPFGLQEKAAAYLELFHVLTDAARQSIDNHSN